MSDVIRWEPDENLEAKAFHFRSSLNPLGDLVREATDEIHAKVKARAMAEASRWEGNRDSTKGLLKKSFKEEKLRYYRAKAMAWSLRAYANTLKAVMVRDGEANYGAVVSYHVRGAEIEFGGTDPGVELGKTGTYLDYPAFGFLRGAL